ncbi:hypothetical protein [Halomonas sp. PA16-9]
MWLQLLIAAVFIAMVISLAVGAIFLIRDNVSSAAYYSLSNGELD